MSFANAVAAVAVAALVATPVSAGTILTRQEAQTCREEPVSDEAYRMDTAAGVRLGPAYGAESSVTVCSLCRFPVEVSAGSSLTAIDVDLILRSLKGTVRFSGNLLPFISDLQEQCAHRRDESVERRRDP